MQRLRGVIHLQPRLDQVELQRLLKSVDLRARTDEVSMQRLRQLLLLPARPAEVGMQRVQGIRRLRPRQDQVQMQALPGDPRSGSWKLCSGNWKSYPESVGVDVSRVGRCSCPGLVLLLTGGGSAGGRRAEGFSRLAGPLRRWEFAFSKGWAVFRPCGVDGPRLDGSPSASTGEILALCMENPRLKCLQTLRRLQPRPRCAWEWSARAHRHNSISMQLRDRIRRADTGVLIRTPVPCARVR
jgi:hypothetical protein